MSKFRSFYPFDFQLLNENGEHAFFIEDRTDKITLSITNKGTLPLTFRVQENENQGNEYHHFKLRFRPGTLLNPEDISLDHEDWELVHSKFHGMDVLTFFLKDNATETSLQIEPGGDLQLSLTSFGADRRTGARETSVELISDNLYNDNPEQIIKATRLVKWPVINHRGQATLPIHVGIIGSNTILNNGASNELTLRVSLLQHKDSLKLVHHLNDNERSKIIISFDEGSDQEEWNIADITSSHSFESSISDPYDQYLEISKNEEGFPTLFTVNCYEKDVLLGLLDNDAQTDVHHIPNHFDIKIANIITNHPSGKTNCYIRFENIPGYWDNSFIVPIEKQPMIFRGDKMGIGKMPSAKLDIGGNSPGEIQAILTRGSDENFQVIAQNGVASHNNGGLLGKLGMRYEKNNQWAAGLRFKKGTAHQDVSISIDTNDQERINIASDGLVVIKEELVVSKNLTVKGKLDVLKDTTIKGDLKSEGSIKDKNGLIMPVGAVIAYAGKTAPKGWLLCNGYLYDISAYKELHKALGSAKAIPHKWSTDGIVRSAFQIPDLRSRFIVGAGVGNNLSNYKLYKKGGEEKHKLTIAEMPAHTHQYSIASATVQSGTSSDRVFCATTAKETGSTGGNQSHDNIPPYYALTYIIKY